MKQVYEWKRFFKIKIRGILEKLNSVKFIKKSVGRKSIDLEKQE